jgi:hypothetical protein
MKIRTAFLFLRNGTEFRAIGKTSVFRNTGSALLKVMSGLMKSAGDSVIATRLRTVAFSCKQASKQETKQTDV